MVSSNHFSVSSIGVFGNGWVISISVFACRFGSLATSAANRRAFNLSGRFTDIPAVLSSTICGM